VRSPALLPQTADDRPIAIDVSRLPFHDLTPDLTPEAIMRGKLMILSAPSGAGKSSLARALVKGVPGTAISVSHTTRAPRPGEQEGVDYFFVDRGTFEAMVRAGRFLEYAEVFDSLYGTSRDAIEAELYRGNNVLLDIDWQGARRIRDQMPEALSVFILPPSRAALEERLRGRGQDSEEVIRRRMRDAASEMSHAPEFQFQVVNDDFEAAVADLRALLEGRTGDVRPLAADLDDLLAQ
jgi:guanylate kinase